MHQNLVVIIIIVVIIIVVIIDSLFHEHSDDYSIPQCFLFVLLLPSPTTSINLSLFMQYTIINYIQRYASSLTGWKFFTIIS